jgi:hypothetical protein
MKSEADFQIHVCVVSRSVVLNDASGDLNNTLST